MQCIQYARVAIKIGQQLVGCLRVPSVIFWTKVPNLQGLLGRVC